MKFLTAARAEYQAAGFEVTTIRVVPQPLGEYIRGMKHADAVAMVRKYGELRSSSARVPTWARVMDDRFATDVAIDVFSTTNINGSLIVADEHGIHWKIVREAARVIKQSRRRAPRATAISTSPPPP